MSTDAEIQYKLCSNSRRGRTSIPDRMGQRLFRNIAEAAPFMDKRLPILDVGCGDGLSLEEWKRLGFGARGIEFTPERVAVARSFGLAVAEATAEDFLDLTSIVHKGYNVFCSHTLEHCRDQAKAMQNLLFAAAYTVWIIVPVEFTTQSKNAAHFSAVKNLEQLKRMVPSGDWVKIKEEYRFNLEVEGVLAFRRR